MLSSGWGGDLQEGGVRKVSCYYLINTHVCKTCSNALLKSTIPLFHLTKYALFFVYSSLLCNSHLNHSVFYPRVPLDSLKLHLLNCPKRCLSQTIHHSNAEEQLLQADASLKSTAPQHLSSGESTCVYAFILSHCIYWKRWTGLEFNHSSVTKWASMTASHRPSNCIFKYPWLKIDWRLYWKEQQVDFIWWQVERGKQLKPTTDDFQHMQGSGSLPPHQLPSLRGKKRQTTDNDAPPRHKFNTRNSPRILLFTRQKKRAWISGVKGCVDWENTTGYT